MGQKETEKEGVSESKDIEKVLQIQNFIQNVWKKGMMRSKEKYD